MKIWSTVVVLQVLVQPLVQCSLQLLSFQLKDSRADLPALTSGFRAPEVARCAISCVQMSAPCYSFEYNEETSACTPAASVQNGKASVSPFDGYLFSSLQCSKPGYKLHIQKNVATCIRLSKDNLNYTAASRSCQEEGSQLLTLKTQDKLDLFNAARKPSHLVWVGLDDMRSEGVYQWIDDQTIVTPDFREKLFGLAQPDNRDKVEHCCVYDLKYSPLNDVNCQMRLQYYCESMPQTLSAHYAS